MSDDQAMENRWWGRFEIPEGAVRHWRVGPADLWVENLSGEWRTALARRDDPMDATFGSELLQDHPVLTELGEVHRFAESAESVVLTLEPALADRPIVTRPETPFHVPAGEQVTLHVSTPLWMRLLVGDPGRRLQEIPIHRPSDTWFGANTLDGDVCYASFTRFVVRLENAPMVPHRATTAVRIRNQAEADLLLDRIRLPVANLSVFQAPDGRIWTNDVTMDRKEATEFAEIRVGKGGPASAPKATKVAEPREPNPGNPVIRVFSKLLNAW